MAAAQRELREQRAASAQPDAGQCALEEGALTAPW